MPTLLLTKRAVEAISMPVSGQVFYRDAELSGFGLRVGTKTKTFFAEKQVKRRTVRVSIGRFPLITPEQARKAALRHLSEMAGGFDVGRARAAERASAITIATAFRQFFEVKRNLSPVTVDNYARTPRLYLADWSEKPMNEITRQMVLDRHRYICEKHGAIVANNVFRHFRSVYNFIAATRDELPPNPVTILSQTRTWSPERRRRTLITAYQLPAWWQAVTSETELARDFLVTALFTGMRKTEIATLRWSNIDLVGRTLHVPRTKNGQPLILPLSKFLAELFEARKDATGNSDWVFRGSGRSGHVTETKSFTRRVAQKSGLRFTLHDLRRSFITIAESLDIPAYALKRLLNHATDTDVTGGYIVMDAERLRGPVERIAGRIQELANGTSYQIHCDPRRPQNGSERADRGINLP